MTPEQELIVRQLALSSARPTSHLLDYIKSLLTQARADEREACAKVCDELARTQRETNDKYPMHALAYPQWRERISYYEQCATAIRARKDGQ